MTTLSAAPTRTVLDISDRRHKATCALLCQLENGGSDLSMTISIQPDVALFFRDQLRAARAEVLKDSEAFDEVVLVLERLGRYLMGKREIGLGKYEQTLTSIAKCSPLADAIPAQYTEYHIRFVTLFDLLKEARNSAVHEGAVARHLSANAIEVALVLEDALMVNSRTVGDFMVRNPSVALPWQPLSMIRQVMLSHSFSYLPVRTQAQGGQWQVVADFELARFFREASGTSERHARMATSLGDGVRSGQVQLRAVTCVGALTRIEEVLGKIDALPVLVIGSSDAELIGILTAFDLL